MIKQLLFGVFFVLLFSKIYALELEYFQCPNENNALKCSKVCTPNGSVKFKLGDKTKNILLVVKDQNNTTSETLKNCEVIDIMNWTCNLDKIFSSSMHVMNKGKYYSSLSYRMLDGTDDKRFTCAVN